MALGGENIKERVHKIIAERGFCSRRAAEKLIEDGQVRVNGRKVKIGAVCDSERDLITIGDKKLLPLKKRNLYILLNKPRGYITTVSDDFGRKTVMELIKNVDERVYPVGRLDRASEGILLLTNDGEVARYLTHPSSGIEKEYHVTVVGDVLKSIPMFEKGIKLDDGFKTQPMRVKQIRDFDEKTILSFTLTEGHNRIIRKACEIAGLKIRRLVRVSFGELKLENIKPASWRHATAAEEKYLHSIRLSAGKSASAKGE